MPCVGDRLGFNTRFKKKHVMRQKSSATNHLALKGSELAVPLIIRDTALLLQESAKLQE